MATQAELIERFEAWRKPRNRFMTFTRNERYHLEKDKCIIKLDVTEDDLNPFDAIHGLNNFFCGALIVPLISLLRFGEKNMGKL